jgi:hypothetical protein
MSYSSGGEGGVRLQVRPAVAVAVRARMIAQVAREIAAAAGADSHTLDLVAKGFDRQTLAQVELIFEDARGNDIGYLSIAVDWDKCQLNVMKDAETRTIKLDPGRPVTEQLSGLLASAAAYVSAKLAELGAARTRETYTARPGYHDRMMRELGLVELTAESTRKLRAAQAKVRQFHAGRPGAPGLYVQDSRLSELSLAFVRFAGPPQPPQLTRRDFMRRE